MIVGVFWALLAGFMLGLYALPSKFTKEFEFENTWGLFFLLTMFVVPLIATFTLLKGVGDVFAQMPASKLAVVVCVSFLWGCGVMFWGKAITHIGISLGFSLFIGTVILIGSILPWFIEGLPGISPLVMILLGIIIVLVGIMAYGKAGLLREKDEAKEKEREQDSEEEKKGSMAKGILIAVSGGLLATGFSVANTVGRPVLHQASQKLGNPDWATAVAVMFPIFLSGGVAMTVYFIWQLNKKKAWRKFKTPRFPVNFILIFIMAFFHYAASAVFAYSAYKLGTLGNSVGYAIFNSASVVTAVVMGLITREWVKASSKAKNWLYTGLICMILGIVLIAVGNSLGKPDLVKTTTAVVQN